MRETGTLTRLKNSRAKYDFRHPFTADSRFRLTGFIVWHLASTFCSAYSSTETGNDPIVPPAGAPERFMRRMTPKKSGALFAFIALLIAFAADARPLNAQAPSQRFVGTITAISGDTLTVKTDSGESHPVQVPSSAALKRISPG